MKLYKIVLESDFSKIGTYPQIEFYKIKDKDMPYDNVWFKSQTDMSVFDMEGMIHIDAKQTHFLSCSELSPKNGFLIDNNTASLLDQYLPKSCLLHPFLVKNSFLNSQLKYKFLEVGVSVELINLVDFEKSTFYQSLFDEFISEIKITSWDDWQDKQQEENVNMSSISIEPKELIIVDEFFDDIGIIKFPFNATIYCTEKIVETLAINQISGIVITEEKNITIHCS